MRLLDHDEPIDPEVAASLDAIDAVLAGDPVAAEYAELAEIALLLSAERPQARSSFTETMDERVARRFAPIAPPAARKPKRRWRSAGVWEAAGAMAAGVALIVGIAIVVGGPGGAASESSSSAASSPAALSSEKSAAAAPASTTAGGSSETGSAASSAPSSVQPPTAGRKVVQSAQLQLAAAPNRIDDVAQQVYDVIGELGGIVQNSTVTQTSGSDGSANFQLSVPSASLGQAMSRLSSLNYASVLSRTDASQDVTDQYGAAQRALSDARALRTSLLAQLANATTTEQTDSLKARIHDAEASISSDEATLARLNHEVGFSSLALQISAQTPAPVAHHNGGFGIGRAAHDAGRVLTVAAGVALIGIAALAPVALVAALLWWAGSAVRRRRREQALDSA